MSTFNVVQPEIHTAPIGAPAVWEPIMNRSGGQCECTGSCGRSHSKSEFRCDRHHDRGGVRLVVAPHDLTLPLERAVGLPVGELRAWCPDCHRLARRRQREGAAARARFDSAPAEGLFDL